MTEPVAIGVDVGGTKVAAGAVAVDGTIHHRLRVDTPVGDAGALLETIARVIASVEEASGASLPVGVGVAGIVDAEGRLVYGPNLDLHDWPVGAALRDRIDAPVIIKNDATVALWGEARIGAGRGSDDLLLLTIGTGVGGAVLTSGQLVEGAHGFGGELGHVIVADGGRLCACGNLGCLEAYASGSAIGRIATDRLAEGPSTSTLSDLAIVDGRAVTHAAEDGDRLAQDVLREVGYWLGVGLVTFVNTLDPDRIIIGGGAAKRASTWLLPAAEEVVRTRVLGAAHRPLAPLTLAELGNDAGMIGAALLAAGA